MIVDIEACVYTLQAIYILYVLLSFQFHDQECIYYIYMFYWLGMHLYIHVESNE